MPRKKTPKPPSDPFRWFDSSPEVIRLVVMMYVRYPLSLRNVEDLLHERGIDICHETVRLWWRRFGPMFASEIRKKRVEAMRQDTHWRWHLDEVYMKIDGEMRYLWRAVDHEGEVLESFVTKERDRAAALTFIKKAMKRHGRPRVIVTDGLRSYGAALKALGGTERQEVGRHLNNRAENVPEGAGLLATGLMIGHRMELWYAPAGQAPRKPDGVHDRQPVADPAPGATPGSKPQPTPAPAGAGR